MDGNLRQVFRWHLQDLHWQPIESSSTAPGIPDMNYCGGNPHPVEGWIENKRTLGWTVKFRPFQVPWLMQRSRAGGRCFVAVRQMSSSRDNLHILPGSMAQRLAVEGLRTCPTTCFEGGPGRWDWDQIRNILLGR